MIYHRFSSANRIAGAPILDSVSADQLTDDFLGSRFVDMADRRGVPETDVPLNSLIKCARTAVVFAEMGLPYDFRDNGLVLTRPRYELDDEQQTILSKLHFLPNAKIFINNAIAIPHQFRKLTNSQIGSLGIVGMQNYVLMVDAGLIVQPDKLVGTTNFKMARAARRLGFEQAGSKRSFGGVQYSISADYSGVAEQAFSADIRRLQEDLRARNELRAARRNNR